MMNSRSIVMILALIVFALALLAPRAWATPAQNPARQTVPTRVKTIAPPPQPTREPPAPPTNAPAPTARPDTQPTAAGAPTAGFPTIPAAPTPAAIATPVVGATPIPNPGSGATPGATPPTIATNIPPRGLPPSGATTAVTLTARDETRAPTITLAASSSNLGASAGGVSPLLCGGGVLVLLGVGVVLVGRRRA
jgi:hypothetical protein